MRVAGIEPAAFAMWMRRSATELNAQILVRGVNPSITAELYTGQRGTLYRWANRP